MIYMVGAPPLQDVYDLKSDAPAEIRGEVHATLYHHFGIDPHASTLPDFSGRPHDLVDEWKPMPELI